MILILLIHVMILLVVENCQSIRLPQLFLSSTNKPQSSLNIAISHISSLEQIVTNVRELESNSLFEDEYTRIIDNVQYKHYQPSSFRKLRQLSGFSEEQYEQILQYAEFHEISSDSKSGQTFLRSGDGKLIIKTIKKNECQTMCSIVGHLIHHIQESPRTCLNNVLGLYRVKDGNSISYLLVCRNIFNPCFPINDSSPPKLFDLKGSLVGRFRKGNSIVLKDLDLIQSPVSFDIAETSVLLEALSRDIEFLIKFGLIDYSLLIWKGITVGTMTSPPIGGSLVLPCKDGTSCAQFGIIDFLQKYNARKRFESFFKSLCYGKTKISCVDPVYYGKRMISFVRQQVCNNSG